MELQFYQTTTPATTTWSSFPSHEIKDSNQGHLRWQLQQTSDYSSNHIESPVLHRYPTENFYRPKDSRSPAMKDIVIPKPNRMYVQYSRKGIHHGGGYRPGNQAACLRSDENGFIRPLFVTQKNKVQGGSDRTTESSLDNSYKHYRKPMDNGLHSPCKKHKVSWNFHRDDEDTASAFKAFKRNENSHQFSRIDERNRNLPPPPPLVKTNNKIRNDYQTRSQELSKSREDIILIRGSSPSQLRHEKYQPDSRRSLQASVTVLHHSEPILSTAMEYQQPTGAQESYNPRDTKRKSMEVVRNNHQHHHCDSHSTLSNGFSHISNSRNNTILQRETPLAITHNPTSPHFERHSGIPSHPDYHHGVSFSTTKTTLGFNKNCPELLKYPSPTHITTSSQPFRDTHVAFHPRKQFISSSNTQVKNYVVVPDSVKNNSREFLKHPMYSQNSPNLEFSFDKESRVFKDQECTAFQKISERPGLKKYYLPFEVSHKMPQSPKKDGGEPFKHDGQLKSTRQPLIVPHKPLRHHVRNLNEIKRFTDTQSSGASSPPRTQILNLVSERLSSSLSLDSQMNGSEKDALFSELSELAPTPPQRRPSSLSHPVFCKPKAHMKNQNSVISQEEKIPCSAPKCAHLSFSNDFNENKPHNNKRREQSLSSQSKTLGSPPDVGLQVLESKTATKETETQGAPDKAPKKQKNKLEMFEYPLKPRPLSYPFEKTHFNENHSKITSNGCFHRTLSEYDKNPRSDTEFSQSLDSSRDEKDASNTCGGYAFDHDSLPIIVAVHSVVVEDKKTKEIESSQEEQTKKGTSNKDTVTASSHYTGDTKSTSRNEQKRYQKPPLLPDTSERANLSMEIEVSAESQERNQNVSTTDTMDEKPVNTVCNESFDDIKKNTQTLKSVSVLYSNELLEEKEDQAIRIEGHYMTFVNDVTNVRTEKSTSCTSEFSQLISRSAYEEIVKTSKSSPHRRQSVEELSNKIMETMERINKEEIEWKKKLLHRLKFVLVKKLKKAEKNTGVKASINLPSEINFKGKEEQKKSKTCKRNKSNLDEPSVNVEKAKKDIKVKYDDITLKESDHNRYEAKLHKRKSMCVLKTELGNTDDHEQSTCKKVGQKISPDSKKMNKINDEVNENINEDTTSINDEELITSGNDRKDETITGNSNESLLLLNSDSESDSITGLGYCDLVIDE